MNGSNYLILICKFFSGNFLSQFYEFELNSGEPFLMPIMVLGPGLSPYQCLVEEKQFFEAKIFGPDVPKSFQPILFSRQPD